MTHDPPLTPREWQVCWQVARGYPNKRIASNLGIEIDTVEAHIKAIAVHLPNPDDLPAKTLVMLWSAHRLWLTTRDTPNAA